MQLSSRKVGVKSGEVMENEPLHLPAIKEKGFDLSQCAAAGTRLTHTIVFLTLRHYQVICLFNAVAPTIFCIQPLYLYLALISPRVKTFILLV